ncbi:MAG TPA: LLM class flavin-dependent oxidoreductase [Chloroflexota bacterium]|jgi:alkanesulfonate monooxygenase SsuD/methylene tetrahydromethanopterin reductase-like flavin-dependent oxidoreductase (luciferase family)
MAASGTRGTDTPALQFGIFDWLDRNDPVLGDTYEQRLRLLEAADAAGFYCYHLAEHHGTPLGMAPSPSLLLAAASQRTRRIRLGPLVYTLPVYAPIRLAEEICMLDQLTRGRLEVGIGRGTSPHEMAVFNVDAADSRAMFEEALAIIRQALVEGKASYEGRYFAARDVELMVRPVQRPYPPLWYPTSNAQSVPWVAGQGISTMFSHNTPTLEETRQNVQVYWRAYAEHRDDPDRLNAHVATPKVGLMRQVYVAETDAAAMREATAGYAAWFQNYTYLWALHGNTARHERKADLETAVAERRVLVGSPATVRALVQECLDATGVNYFVPSFTWGNLTTEQVLRSLDLFAREVMPAVRAPALAPAGR